MSQEERIEIKPFKTANQNKADSISLSLNQKKETTFNELKKEVIRQGYFDFVIKKLDTSTFNKKYIVKLNNHQKNISLKIKSEDLIYIPKEIKIYNGNEIKIEITKTEALLKKISEGVKKNGNVFFEVQIKNIKKSNETLEGKLSITFKERKKRTIDKIIVKGYEKFPKKFINKHLKIKINQTVDLIHLKKRASKLKTLDFAKQKKSPELLFKKDSTILYMYVQKKKRNSFDGVIGFNTNEVDGKLDFTGYLNLNLLNNFNTGEKITLSYRSDENKQRLINLKLDNPYLFKTPFNSSTKLNIFSKDSTFTTTYLAQEFSRNIGDRNKIGIGIENTNSNVTTNNTTNNDLLNYKTNSAFVVYEFYNNEALINNKEKFHILLKNSFGTRKTIKSTINQLNLEITSSKLIKLNQKNYFYLKTTNRKLFSENLIKNELHRFGGVNTIRGFDENSIEADSYYTLNIEYIYTLNNLLSINTITDFAYFENLNLTQKEKLLSVGLGIAATTKSGLLNLIIATGKTENDRFKYSNTKIHISLKTYF
jgi:outer membrane protein assembly factor BamA